LRITEQIAVLRQRIRLQRLPNQLDRIIDRSLDHIQKSLSNAVLDQDRRACLISSCSKVVAQYKFELMSMDLNTKEDIRRGHQRQATVLKDTISQCCSTPLQQAIESRQHTMRQCHERRLKYKLMTFFDEAPTIIHQ
jgi:hypothetical protein